jgi:non-hemolytic enterotoxin B/C
MSDPSAAAAGINAANTAQTSQALIVQTYCNCVNEQPQVDFSKDPALATYQTQINAGLATAQDHANNYLNNIQPAIIQNITNIGNYYAINNAVATSLPADATEDQWIEALTTLQNQCANYERTAQGVVDSLASLNSALTSDSSAFATIVSNLNTAVNGDDGALSQDDSELTSIQGKIDGAIAGIVASAVAVVGGAIMIFVGAVATFATAGAASGLVIGGIGVLAGGLGGETGSAFALASFNNQKASLLADESRLNAEVKLALGVSNSYQSLQNQVSAAVTAATQMKSAWSFLSGDLAGMASDLQQGTTTTGVVQTAMLSAANTVAKTVLTDIATIKTQMAGVTSTVAPAGQTVADVLIAAAQQMSSADRVSLRQPAVAS